MEFEEISPSIKTVLCFDQGILETMVNESPAAQVLVDREMRLLAVSENWCKEFGFDREKAIGLTYYALLPEFPARCRQIHRRCLSGETLKCERDRLVRSDGREHWYRWDIGPWYNESRQIGGILIYLDIHTKLEDTLSELHSALSAAEIGVWVRDLINGKIEWSGQTEKIWGYRPGEFDGSITAFTERVYPDDLQALNASLETAVSSGRPYSQEFRIRWPDGSIHWIRARAVCEYGEDKRALRLRGASVDITEIEHARQTLRIEKDRLKEILDATTEAEKVAKIGTWSLSIPSGETHWSEGVFRIFSLPVSQSPPTLSELEAKYIHPDDIHVIHGMLDEIEKGANQIEIEHRIIPTGSPIAWVRAVAKVTRDQNGKPARLIGTVQDITASHQLLEENVMLLSDLEKKVEERTHELSIAMEAKARFLANMSHEIRNPLNTVNILTSLLGHNGLTEEKRKSFVQRITASTRMVTEILDDILDFSKMGAHQISLDECPFSLAELLDETRALFLDSADQKGIELHIPPTKKDFYLVGDKKRLKQILANLVSNAIKFTESGSVWVKHSITELADGSIDLFLEVTDSGIGIEASALANIFDPFTQADNGISRKYGGTGLGLSIAKSLAELMKGSIEVQSTPGLGSSFKVRVRLGKIPSWSSNASDSKSSEKNRLEGCRILIVDDDPVNVQTMEDLLSSKGAKTFVAYNGIEALQTISEISDTCDVVLMDIQMPEMDGITATQKIRSELNLTSLPVIAVTGGGPPRSTTKSHRSRHHQTDPKTD